MKNKYDGDWGLSSMPAHEVTVRPLSVSEAASM